MAIAPEEGITAKQRAAINNAITAKSAQSAANPFNALVSRLNASAVKAEEITSAYDASQAAKAAFDPAKDPDVIAAKAENVKIAKEIGGAVSTVTGQVYNKPTTATPTGEQQDSIAAITALLASYGIGDLAGPITNAVMKGYSSKTIELIMQDPNSTDPLALAFQTRFPANKIRSAAGKSVLSPAEYLRAERSYTEVLKSYGVQGMASKDNISSFLSNDISATEVADRVGLAVDRVNNADQATKDALKTFYPMLTQGDLVQAVLAPTESLPALKRKIQIAEIGGAAAAQNLTMGLADITTKSDLYGNTSGGTIGAEALAALGVTKAKAQEGYRNIADVLPRSEFLSSITGGADYTQKQAEQEQFQGLASAKRAREALSATEVGRFSGSAGRLATKNTSRGTL